MPLILIHAPGPEHQEWRSMLSAPGHEIVVRTDRESLVQALAERRPDVLVYVLADLEQDLRLLRTLREVAPTLPIILLDGDSDLAARRSIQELRPTYYAVLPLEASELHDAVEGALHRVVRG